MHRDECRGWSDPDQRRVREGTFFLHEKGPSFYTRRPSKLQGVRRWGGVSERIGCGSRVLTEGEVCVRKGFFQRRSEGPGVDTMEQEKEV